MSEIVGTGILGAIVTWIALAISRPMLLRWGALDVPNHRSSHDKPTVRAGGVGVAAGMLVALLAAVVLGSSDPSLLWITAVLILFASLGLVEDLAGLPIKVRLAGQLILACALAFGLNQSNHFSQVLLLAFAVCITFFYVNVSNFMDGINGISGLHGVVVGLYFSLLGHHYDSRSLALTGVAIASCFGAFLPWNAPRARMFLGDSGSYLLGASVSAVCLMAMSNDVPPVACVAPLAIYSADVTRTLIVRYRRGERLTDAHKDHVYQQMQRLFSSHLLSAFWTAVATMACCLVAWASVTGPRFQPLSVLAIALIVITYIASPKIVASTVKVIDR